MRPSRTFTRTPQALAADFASRCLAAERLFVAALWLDPIGGNDAAHDAGLTGDDFADPVHAYIFFYVCKCAEPPSLVPNYADCLTVAGWSRVALSGDELLETLDGIYSDPDGCREGSVYGLAEAVADFAEQRRKAQAAFLIWRGIIDPSAAGPTSRLCVPKHLSRIGKDHDRRIAI